MTAVAGTESVRLQPMAHGAAGPVERLAEQDLFLEQAEAEKQRLARQNLDLRRRLERAREQERALVTSTEAEAAEFQAQHNAVRERYRRTAEAEAALAERLSAEHAEQRQEILVLRLGLHQAEEDEARDLRRLEDEVAARRDENRALRGEYALLAMAAPPDAPEPHLDAKEWELRAELQDRVQYTELLQDRLLNCEDEAAELDSQLRRLPSAADVAAQREVLRLLQTRLQQIRPEAEAAEAERASLEQTVLNERDAAEEEARLQSTVGERAEELMDMKVQLNRLRDMYTTMRSKCSELERERQPRRSPRDTRCVEVAAALRRGDVDLQRLRSELAVAEESRSRLQGEELRLMDAAYQDQAMIAELRGRLRQSENLVARLEARGSGASPRRPPLPAVAVLELEPP